MRKTIIALLMVFVGLNVFAQTNQERTDFAQRQIVMALNAIGLKYDLPQPSIIKVSFNTQYQGSSRQTIWINVSDWFSRDGFLYVNLTTPIIGFTKDDNLTSVMVDIMKLLRKVADESLPLNVRMEPMNDESYINLAVPIEVNSVNPIVMKQYLELLALWGDRFEIDLDTTDDF
jgi:hypothetical protein